MKTATLQEEKKLRKKGYKKVAGLDEAGRGPLAGPVTAAAVVVENYQLTAKNFQNIRDSKKLSAGQREKFYRLIKEDKNIEWGIGIVSEKVIDRINIFEATKLAMQKAVSSLGTKIDYLILDGNFKINSTIPQKSIIKGDEKVFSCALASIIAKVTRDRIMLRYHKQYPQYGLDKHKGYPTELHCQMLKKYGPCKIHRKTFGPVKACLQN